MKKHHLLVVAAFATFAPAFGARAAFADAQPLQEPRISIDQARAAALRAVAGTVVHEHMEGKRVYEFKIRANGSAKDAPLKEVKVSADTGTVMGIEDDDGDEDDDK